jgi:hypothetical protein
MSTGVDCLQDLSPDANAARFESMDDPHRQARARARRKNVTLHRASLHGNEPDPHQVSGGSAVSLVEPLTREGWASANLPFPSYTRAAIPIRFARGHPE